jgi:hypothetical protein
MDVSDSMFEPSLIRDLQRWCYYNLQSSAKRLGLILTALTSPKLWAFSTGAASEIFTLLHTAHYIARAGFGGTQSPENTAT